MKKFKLDYLHYLHYYIDFQLQHIINHIIIMNDLIMSADNEYRLQDSMDCIKYSHQKQYNWISIRQCTGCP